MYVIMDFEMKEINHLPVDLYERTSLYSQSFVNPQISINSGQMFLWEQKDNSWYGTYGDKVIKFSASTTNFDSFTRSNKNTTLQFSSHPEVKGWERNVFRVDDDIRKIISTVSKDTLVYKAIRKYPGLRLMRQEPHQCIFSFVCARWILRAISRY